MALSCGASLVKCGLFLFNLLTAIGGIVLIVLGVNTLHPNDHLKVITDIIPKEISSSVVPSLAITAGVIVFLISFFGCFGALTENNCMIKTYCLILIFAAIGVIVLSYFAFKYPTQLADGAVQGYDANFKKYNDSKPASDLVDSLQKAIKCCGTTGPNVWKSIPDSCCDAKPCTSSNSYKIGCDEQIRKMIKEYESYISWGSIIFALLLFAGVAFTCCLSDSIGRSSYEYF